MDKEYFRFYIKVRTALYIEPIVIHNELRIVFGDEAPSLTTVQTWSKWFREGRVEVEDEERPGRPITKTTSKNIRQVCDLINDDPKSVKKSSNAAWVASGNYPPTVARRSHFAPRTLLAIFFKSTGPVLIHSFKCGQTIDHQYFINNCLRPVIDEIQNKRPSLGIPSIKLHHDNGKAHIHDDVVNYLQSEGVTIMPYLPNSPNLAPCNF
ncbi:unnamed protein product [Rotaria sordida]|uniref:Transposase n=1 Tax=Rotaria sordida TaxID=392033 RepID=A0A818ZM58_9BILA|nr:unnamed protein product [Rotaria sordida]